MPEPSFLLDGMLGSLARWLRIMGYDSEYLRDEEDSSLLSILGDRFLLTRDRQLAHRAGHRGYYLESDDLDVQLSTVVERFDLRLDLERSRCTACNGPLDRVPKDQVKEKVEEGTWNEHQEFWMCRECGKVYWHGAHWKNIRDRLDRIS
ncbi:MAG: Mut7-C RNAse domain-containing protein [Methanomassiliicoccales archaeon]